MPFVNSTLFFGFVYHISCLPWYKIKNDIRCIDAPKCAFTHRNLPESEKHIWIIQYMYMKVSILLNYHHAKLVIESRATKHSFVSAFSETVEFLERSLASCLWDIARAWLAVVGFCLFGFFCIMFWNKRVSLT